MGIRGFLLSVVFALGAGAAMAWVLERPALERRDAGAPSESAKVANIGGTFTLVDHTGRQVTDKDFLGRYMLIYFGYTYCPDICPAELQVMSEALDQLGPEAKEIQPVFVTVDPQRDTVDTLAHYVKHFRADLVGLTGTGEQIAQIAKAYRVYYGRDAKEGDPNYAVNHSSVTYLMDPKGKFVTFFPYGTKADEMAKGIKTHL